MFGSRNANLSVRLATATIKKLPQPVTTLNSRRPVSSLVSSFSNSVINNPNYIAMIHDDVSVSYEELDDSANKLCAKFQNEYNLQKGDRVLHMSDLRIDGTQIMLACAKLGLVHVPTYPMLTQSQFEKVVSVSEPSLIISESGFVDKAVKCGYDSEKTLILNQQFDPSNWLASEQSDSDASEINKLSFDTTNDDDVFCVLFTSGTTGDPKGCVHTHRSMFWNAMFMHDFETERYEVGLSSQPFVPADISLSLVPQHGGASVITRFSKFLDGKSVLLPNTQNFRFAQHWIDLMNKYEDQTFECMFFGKAMSDMFISHRAATAAGEPYVVPNLSYFFYGGDFAPLGLVSYLKENLFVNAQVRMAWGMTEIGIGSYCDPLLHYSEDNISVPIGQLGQIPNQFTSDIKLDESSGEILFKLNKYGMTGYYKNEEKTKELIDSEGYVRTGDLGRIDEETGYFYLTGRKKDVIMLQEDTRVVYPIDIESVVIGDKEMTQYLNDIAVVGCPNELLRRCKSEDDFGLLGESPVAVITLRPNCELETAQVVEKIYKLCEEKLSPIMQIKHVFCVEAMPKGPTNKLSKTKLKEMIVNEEFKIEKTYA